MQVFSDGEVSDWQVAAMLEQFATAEPAEGPIAAGDTCSMDMITKQDEKVLPGVSGEGMMIRLTPDMMPQGFIDQVSGMRPGEEREFDFYAPSGGDAPDALFHTKVRLVEKRDQKLPELTDAFVAEHFGQRAKTVAEMRASMKGDIQAELEQQYRQQCENQVDAELAKRIDGRIPDLLYERQRESLLENMRQQLSMQGSTIEQFMKQQGMNEQNFGMMLMMQASTALRQGFALDALFRHERLTVDEADVQAALSQLAPGNEEAARANFDANDAWFVVRETAERIKAHNFAVEHATFTS